MAKEKEVDAVEEKSSKRESEERVAFRNLIAVYKEQSPAKYELKKAELEAKLAKIK